jgi:hypothetical protein
LYILAFAACTTTLVLMTARAWLAFQHDAAAGSVQLTVSFSGNALGGFASAPGISWDDRAERERQRADRAEEELRSLRDQQRLEARFRRLEEAFGLTPGSETVDDQSGEN